MVSTVRGGGLPARGLLGDRLGRIAAQPCEIDQPGHLPGVAECARGDHDRIGQTQAAELNIELDIGGIHRWSCRPSGWRW